MRPRPAALIPLWCLLAGWPAAEADSTAPVLVVAPGDRVAVRPPEPGLVSEAAIGGGVLRPVDGEVRAPAAGDHWLAVASRDAAGNRSPLAWIRLLVDGRAPEVSVTVRPEPVAGDGGRRWIPPGAEAVAKAADRPAGVASVTVGLDGGETASGTDEARLPLPRAAGDIAVVAGAEDRVGNVADAQRLALAVDAAPPRAAIRVLGVHVVDDPEGGAGEGGPVLAPAASLALDVDDPESGVDPDWQGEVDGEAVARETWLAPWPAGRHRATARVRDRVGNETVVGPFPFRVDDRGPEIRWQVTGDGVVGAGGETVYRPPVTVLVEAADAPAGVEALETATGDAVDGPRMVDGDRLPLRARDRVGNVSEVEARWAIDRAPPEIAVRGPGGAEVPAGSPIRAARGDVLEVAAVDDAAGVATATWVLNNRDVPGRRSPRPLTGSVPLPRPGRYFLIVAAEDRLGHAVEQRWPVQVERRPR